jgi:GcrA cell cycle regulator
MAWSEERIAFIMARFLAHGQSASQIAKELGDGTTREAVSGKLYRLGVKRPEAQRVRALPGRRSPPAPARLTRPQPPAPPEPKTAPSQLLTVPELTDTSTLVPFLAADDWHCRWIDGRKDGVAYVCGKRKARTGAFCAGHAALAYIPPK